MPKRRHTDIWITSIRRWEAGMVGPEGEQLALPGMPEPPKVRITRLLPYVMVTYADHDGTSVRPSHSTLAVIFQCSTRTIRRRIADLEQLGLVAKSGQKTAPGVAQEYLLPLPAWLSKPSKTADTKDVRRSHPNGGHQSAERRTQRMATYQSPSETGTSSDVVGGAERPPATDATDKPAWLPHTLELTDEQRETNLRGIAKVRAAMGIGAVADSSEVTDEARAEALAALEREHPETAAPTEHTETHAAH